jgi:phospholipase C
VTAPWSYAQRFAKNNNSFGTVFGPSTPGLLNLVAGNTYPAAVAGGTTSSVVAINNGVGTVVGDPDPPMISARPKPAQRSGSAARTSAIC